MFTYGSSNLCYKEIKARLKVVSKTSLCLLIKMYKDTGSVTDNRPNARPRKLKDLHYRHINISENDELTGIKLLRMLLQEQFPDGQ